LRRRLRRLLRRRFKRRLRRHLRRLTAIKIHDIRNIKTLSQGIFQADVNSTGKTQL